MRQKRNREINVFSTSAIDLFCSSMGVFILLVVITLPFYAKTSTVTLEDVQKKEKEVKDLQKKLAAEIQNIEPLKKQIEELRKIKTPTPQPTNPPTELENKIKELQNIVETRENSLKTLDAKVTQLEQEKLVVQSLEKEIASLKAIQAKHFLVIALKWSTERHDMDLEVSTPENLTYNFKKKSQKEGTGEFALDSRTGPGAELWQSANAKSGSYVMKASFYNNYGNKNPASVTVTILSQTGTYDLPTFEMDFEKSKNKEVRFALADDGKITFE